MKNNQYSCNEVELTENCIGFKNIIKLYPSSKEVWFNLIHLRYKCGIKLPNIGRGRCR